MSKIAFEDVLNSLTSHIAVLDARARIIYINEPWGRFARANGSTDRSAYVGVDYLSVCEAAARHGDQAAALACDGLRAVMSGERSEFVLEYPCDSPREKRWFVMRVTGYAAGSSANLVVSHEDITARKGAEEALLKTKASLERANRELDLALAREQQLSRTDGLTRIGNRRYFFDLATHECAEAKRYGRGLAVVLFDVDHFKRINDTVGHQAGDDVLRCVARIAEKHLREVDILARYGGEEFIVLLPGSSAREAAGVAERIRTSIAATCEPAGETPVTVTISVGVAEFPGHASGLDPLVRCADRALYQAKRSGRNRTVIFCAQTQ
ncbi:MAG: GGDEF domain-containing protein [Gammaproteobacteria bacterium]